MGIAKGIWASRANPQRPLIVPIPLLLMLFALTSGCAIPPAARRLGAHYKRDAKLAHAENPTETTERLVIGSQVMGGWLGPPKAPVKIADFKKDVADLKLAGSPMGWLGKILILLTSLGGVAGAAYMGNYVLAARRLIGVLTSGIESGLGTPKENVKALIGEVKNVGSIDLKAMLGRWISRAEKGVKT